MISVSPFARRIIMKPPPPRLPAEGQVTASASPTATAASIALPPRCMTSTPTREAISLVEATIPCRARAGSRDAPGELKDSDQIKTTTRRTAQVRFVICHLPTRDLFIDTSLHTTLSTAHQQTSILLPPDRGTRQTGFAFS